MATDQDKARFPLKLLVDEKRNRVVVAEASKDFVDILFGFLTLPMGTVMRITGNQKIAENGVIGGMYHLYRSVKDLGDDNFYTEVCKSSLLNPRNPCEMNCMNLKVEIDDSRPEKYYQCSGCTLTSFYYNARCRCGAVFSRERLFSSRHRIECRGAFLKGGMMFIVSDDLQVKPSSPSSLVQHLSNLGITDMTRVKEMSVEAGVEEISSLLKCSLISKSPFTDVFLVKQGKSEDPIMPEPRNNLPLPGCGAQKGTSIGHLSLKLVLRKSTNTILCAEASDDFIDFLFSFLTIPLGTVVNLLHGQTGLECMDNLHKSVENLESKWLCIVKDNLLNPGVANCYEYWKHPLGIQTLGSPDIRRMGFSAEEQICGRFMKTPSKFLVTDDLAVRDLSSTSCIGFLKGLNVPFYDVEERTVTVGEAQALGILKASLTSSSALTNGLNSLLKMHKQEE